MALGLNQPDDRCTTTEKPTCLTDGLCTETKGVCQNWSNGTICVDAKCSGDKTYSISANLCDGKGLIDSCKDQGTVPCLLYVCDTGNGLCKTSCTIDQDCAANAKCLISGGQTVGVCKLKDGQTCNGGSECFTNNCANNVCCNDPCNRSCESCNQAGNVGFCTAVGAGNPDPKGACATESKQSCGFDGLCGINRNECQKWPGGTECYAAYCTLDVVNYHRICNGFGECSAPESHDCTPYACSGGSCKGSCTTGADCASGYSCKGTVCLKSTGQDCDNDGDCLSGYCTDGVCCGSRCHGTCEKCNFENRHGYCDPVAAGEDSGGDCAVGTPSTSCGTNGKCSGSRSCQYYGPETSCQAAFCNVDVAYFERFCDSAGSCSTQVTQNCPPYACLSGACKTSCNTVVDCAINNSCNGLNRPGFRGDSVS